MIGLIRLALSPRVLRPLFFALALFVLTMALLPKPPASPLDRFGDKFEHMAAFASLALVAALAWRHARWTRMLVALSAFGAAIEVLQAIPALHRDSDVRDWIADTLAVGAVLLIARIALRPGRTVPNDPALD